MAEGSRRGVDFRRCERFDVVTGLWTADSALVPGTQLWTTSAIGLHVQNGSPGYPTATTPQTTVSVTDVDFHRTSVWDLETGDRVFLAEGLIVTGAFTVKQRL